MMQQPSASQAAYQYPQSNSGLADQFANFGADNFTNAAFDPSLYTSGFAVDQPGAYQTNNPSATPSNQLVRRNTSQQLTTRNNGQGQEQWITPSNDTGTAWEVNDSDQDLDRKAAMAKKDAQAKRKQIYPFVLKLWSLSLIHI